MHRFPYELSVILLTMKNNFLFLRVIYYSLPCRRILRGFLWNHKNDTREFARNRNRNRGIGDRDLRFGRSRWGLDTRDVFRSTLKADSIPPRPSLPLECRFRIVSFRRWSVCRCCTKDTCYQKNRNFKMATIDNFANFVYSFIMSKTCF